VRTGLPYFWLLLRGDRENLSAAPCYALRAAPWCRPLEGSLIKSNLAALRYNTSLRIIDSCLDQCGLATSRCRWRFSRLMAFHQILHYDGVYMFVATLVCTSQQEMFDVVLKPGELRTQRTRPRRSQTDVRKAKGGSAVLLTTNGSCIPRPRFLALSFQSQSPL
jgi:hypothetical protein